MLEMGSTKYIPPHVHEKGIYTFLRATRAVTDRAFRNCQSHQFAKMYIRFCEFFFVHLFCISLKSEWVMMAYCVFRIALRPGFARSYWGKILANEFRCVCVSRGRNMSAKRSICDGAAKMMVTVRRFSTPKTP